MKQLTGSSNNSAVKELINMSETNNWLRKFKKYWEARFGQLDKLLKQLKSNNNEK